MSLPLSFSIVTFGCRVNQADSLRLEEAMRTAGAEPAPAEHADVVIVNTCSVTATADQGARQTIRRIARLNSGAKIVVTGCYASRDSGAVEALPGVVRVVPNVSKEELVSLAAEDIGLTTKDRYAGGEGPCGALRDAGRSDALGLEPGVAGRTAYTLRVQTGCEEHCAFCIIPTTRGASRSDTPDVVVAEVRRAVRAGFREVALTGVHLGSYGRDLTPSTTLTALLQRLADEPGDVMFRISSLEPMDCTPELVGLVASSGRFAPHFHLPLQHASDRLLGAMRRPYTLARYDALVTTIRTRLPDAAIGSDIVVGFPGETDDDTQLLLRYLERSPLTHLHVFPYSDRPGTEASTMTNHVHGASIRSRAEATRAVGRHLTTRFHQSQLGQIRPGLAIEDGTVVATDNYLKVKVGPGLVRNARVRVRISDVGDSMRGEVTETSGAA